MRSSRGTSSTSSTDGIITGRAESPTAPRSAPHSTSANTRPLTVATILTPIERVRVDVAAQGMFAAVHRSSMDELAEDVREQRVDAVLVSVARYDPESSARMADVVREFPRVPAFALLTDIQRSTPQSALELGRVGVRTLIRVRTKLQYTTSIPPAPTAGDRCPNVGREPADNVPGEQTCFGAIKVLFQRSAPDVRNSIPAVGMTKSLQDNDLPHTKCVTRAASPALPEQTLARMCAFHTAESS